MKKAKTAILILVILIYCALVFYAIGMEVYVDLAYKDDCERYGYDAADWKYFHDVICKKITPLNELKELSSSGDSGAE